MKEKDDLVDALVVIDEYDSQATLGVYIALNQVIGDANNPSTLEQKTKEILFRNLPYKETIWLFFESILQEILVDPQLFFKYQYKSKNIAYEELIDLSHGVEEPEILAIIIYNSYDKAEPSFYINLLEKGIEKYLGSLSELKWNIREYRYKETLKCIKFFKKTYDYSKFSE